MANRIGDYCKLSAALKARSVPHLVFHWRGDDHTLLDKFEPEQPSIDFSELVPQHAVELTSWQQEQSRESIDFRWRINLQGIKGITFEQKFYLVNGKLLLAMRFFYPVDSRRKQNEGIEIAVATVEVADKKVEPMFALPGVSPLNVSLRDLATSDPDPATAPPQATHVATCAVKVPLRSQFHGPLKKALLLQKFMAAGSAPPRLIGRDGSEFSMNSITGASRRFPTNPTLKNDLDIKQLGPALNKSFRHWTRAEYEETEIDGGIRYRWLFNQLHSHVIVEQEIFTRNKEAFTSVRVGLPLGRSTALELDFGTQRLEWCAPIFPKDMDRGPEIGGHRLA